MSHVLPFTLVALLLAWPPDVLCQESTPDSAQRFLILDTSRVGTLQREVDQARVAGYRVINGDAAFNLLVLEKTSEPTSTHEYRVLWILQNQLKKASAEGFRIMPATLGTSDFPAAVVEKGPNAAAQYDYLIVGAGRTATFEREIVQGVNNGYRVVGMVSGEGPVPNLVEITRVA